MVKFIFSKENKKVEVTMIDVTPFCFGPACDKCLEDYVVCA